jgi:outer membrane protein
MLTHCGTGNHAIERRWQENTEVKLRKLQAKLAVCLILMSATVQSSEAQQTPASAQPASGNPSAPASTGSIQNDTRGTSGLPEAPGTTPIGPLYLRDTLHDYSQPRSPIYNPIAPYAPTSYPAPRLSNTVRLATLLKDGKIYLSLADAVALALENNYDIAIARINLDIADTDLLRARAGSTLRGISAGLVENTLGGETSVISGGGGPGGTSASVGASGTGVSGLVLSTNGGGPAPELLDPLLTVSLEYESDTTLQSSKLLAGALAVSTGTSTFDFGYSQGFLTGTELAVNFNNARGTSTSPNQLYSPQLQSSFLLTATQHLLQGFGTAINGRFILQAKNDRRITDSAFRQQLLYTVNQVENIYWGLVSAYEDEQAKERALAQSTKLSEDNRIQLQFGAMAPLDVISAESSVAADKQALIAAQSNLEYQQLVMKQSIARSLNDPELAVAPVIPTDRVGLERLPEEEMPIEDLVRKAYSDNPQIEQALLTLKNSEVTIKAEKNGLLPILDLYAFYGGSALGGSQNPAYNCGSSTVPLTCASGTFPTIGYSSTLSNVLNNSAPRRGVDANFTVSLRNRTAQADQARSQMEYRQSQMRLQQIYTQIRIQVINAQYALTNDRAQVAAALAARDYAAQSLAAEQTRYKMGASTTTAILQQQRNLAVAEDTLIASTGVYAKDRAALQALLSVTLDRYGIGITAAATGDITQAPVIPNLTAPQSPPPPEPLKPFVAPAPRPM